ncbi:outer membrane beta-barrel protein [Acinetobacter ursingii]|uniref:OmpW/AlkL family protein n=1 Tax=Acinetobacter ursingii TaxID=108980 RepID=UPI00244D4014|nr:OmpW family outer membrane protein [Acinetobacter ursingii]MDG9860841.1 outer membrane beta-barrel protein [Acinetobacter ursingii]MDG9894522.1 outer membrane beta-barrel protein [Acinetobacter ursingii]MDH0008007.1 outer membrane beta-barrel protein [Acinetobacter ursingii]MDH0479779.1 outer membrane beta-barrel protein [Acinetobacter ursingii]MDH2104195.1 outer membrane beta-barrel protein [Acinetobacter ursingii]
MLKQAAVIALLGLSSSVFAGDWQVKVGASYIAPTSDTQTALGKVEADDEFAFTPSVEYFFGDSPFSAELLLATPINHDVLLDGNKVARVKHLPPTITAKYNFKNATRFTPYIGVGATAFIPWDESGLADKVKNDYGFAGQVGFTFQPADAKNWGVYFDVRYADLSPEVRLVDNLGTFDLDIDPVIYTLGYSYRF